MSRKIWSSNLFHLSLLLSLVAPICRPACAAVTVSGSTSGTAAGQDPIIGINDIGRLTINAGSSLASDVAIIGDLVNGIGLVSVTDFTGTASTWTTTSLMVGDAGTGRLEILNGAIVNVDFAANPGAGDLIIGNVADSLGTVIVNGLGSMLRMGDDSTIGVSGTGVLIIEDEGYVIGTNDAITGTDLFNVGLFGRVELYNGRLRTESLTNNGAIIGTGHIDNEMTIGNSTTGRFEVGAGDRMVVNGGATGGVGLDNDGEIVVVGGEIEFQQQFVNSNAAAIWPIAINLQHWPGQVHNIMGQGARHERRRLFDV
ncbi:MAG: hypothetical protein L0228_16370, partial [Planctomycetes bacterium]|nr:hypothetical protein [Planctomycetota bacterium]